MQVYAASELGKRKTSEDFKKVMQANVAARKRIAVAVGGEEDAADAGLPDKPLKDKEDGEEVKEEAGAKNEKDEDDEKVKEQTGARRKRMKTTRRLKRTLEQKRRMKKILKME